MVKKVVYRMRKMEWEKLLNSDRQRQSDTPKNEFEKHRNEFDKDYDRIIYSSSVRRLQDKAQVFPLQENDFTRTRLTHSMEVASLGRSIAWNIGIWLQEKEEIYFKDFWKVKELATLVEVSCLVHDLGNPPFGHYGEDIIRNWFDNWFDSESFVKAEKKFEKKGYSKLTTQQKNDFRFFEGNAQTIRILTKLQFLNDRYGANFTYGTLATLMKYPWSSEHTEALSKKKFGYFYSEKELFKSINHLVGIGDHRHPATYILEAADDIAYLAADIEDGVKKGIVPWEKIYNSEDEKSIKKHLEEKYPEDLKKLNEKIKDAKSNKVPNESLVNIQNFKVFAQGAMIKAVVEAFKENYEKIMSGTLQGDLLDNSTAKELKEKLKDISQKHCFTNEEVLTLELAGNKVITDLLDLFVNAVVEVDDAKKSKNKNEKLFQLISLNFRHIQSLDNQGLPNIDFEDVSLYNRLLLVTDFVSGMTDSYAVNLHRKLIGVKLP